MNLTDTDRLDRGQLTAGAATACRTAIAGLLYPDAADLDLLAPEEVNDEGDRAWLLTWHDGPHGWAHKVERLIDNGVITLPGDAAVEAVEATVLKLTAGHAS